MSSHLRDSCYITLCSLLWSPLCTTQSVLNQRSLQTGNKLLQQNRHASWFPGPLLSECTPSPLWKCRSPPQTGCKPGSWQPARPARGWGGPGRSTSGCSWTSRVENSNLLKLFIKCLLWEELVLFICFLEAWYWRRSSRGRDYWLTYELGLGDQKFLIPFLAPGVMFSYCTWSHFQGCDLERRMCGWYHQDWICNWTELRPLPTLLKFWRAM